MTSELLQALLRGEDSDDAAAGALFLAAWKHDVRDLLRKR